MPRANSSVPRHRRHRKIVKQAKGYYGARSRTFKSAKDAACENYEEFLTKAEGDYDEEEYETIREYFQKS